VAYESSMFACSGYWQLPIHIFWFKAQCAIHYAIASPLELTSVSHLAILFSIAGGNPTAPTTTTILWANVKKAYAPSVYISIALGCVVLIFCIGATYWNTLYRAKAQHAEAALNTGNRFNTGYKTIPGLGDPLKMT